MKTLNISLQNPQPMRLSLKARDVIATSEAQGFSVEALCGSVWVTLNDGADHILNQGQSLPIRDSRRVVIEALTPSEVGFSQPAPKKTGITPSRYAEDCVFCF